MKKNRKHVKTGRQIEVRNLADLKPHPKQDEFFDALGPDALSKLARNIKERGLDQRIQILPNGTILRGHQRVRALLLNGVKRFEVLVCYDLANATEDEIELYFLEDNAHRRQMDPLADICVAIREYELRNKTTLDKMLRYGTDKVRDEIGQLAQMSGRNCSRYINIVRAPKVVQNAFREGKLSLVLAAKVAGLQKKDQEQIADRIRAGEDPKAVLNDVVPLPEPSNRSPRKTGAAFRAGMKHLDHFLGEIEVRVGKIRGSSYLDALPTIQRAQAVLKQLVRQLNNAAADDLAQRQNLAAAIAQLSPPGDRNPESPDMVSGKKRPRR